VPPEVLSSQSEAMKLRTKDNKLGMAIVGALSSDPRMVKQTLVWLLDENK
jgi:hypothetical protein